MTNDKSRAGAATAAMAAVLLWAPLGSAQEDESERAPQFEGPLAEQLEEYWSTDRKLPDLYYKRYEKAGRVELGVHAGALPSEPFHVYIPLGGSVGYYWSESMGVEVGGAGLLRTNTDLSDFLEGELGDAYAPDRVGEDVYQWRANAVVKWSPLYGKVALLQRKLSHFDFNVAGGLGVMGATRPAEDRLTSQNAVLPEFIFGAGFHFWLTQDVAMRLDLRSSLNFGPRFLAAGEEERTGVNLQAPTSFTLGISYML
ncbi:MAG: outer membrane beta-barrel domain-containing protein [Myxococcota bacterium]